jgi:chromatin segregation and condensation protein Rec8/ScpA/Scc1 (kleisin family)
MASRLIHLKTISLLPKYEEEEQKERAELVGQLVEYAACKKAAAELSTRNLGQVLFVRQPMEMEVDLLYRLNHPATDLLQSYFDAVGRGKRRLPPQQTSFSPLVAKPVVSVNSRIIHIMRRMYKNSKLHFSRLFEENKGGRSEIVATFLAVLELCKNNAVSLNIMAREHIFLISNAVFTRNSINVNRNNTVIGYSENRDKMHTFNAVRKCFRILDLSSSDVFFPTVIKQNNPLNAAFSYGGSRNVHSNVTCADYGNSLTKIIGLGRFQEVDSKMNVSQRLAEKAESVRLCSTHSKEHRIVSVDKHILKEKVRSNVTVWLYRNAKAS